MLPSVPVRRHPDASSCRVYSPHFLNRPGDPYFLGLRWLRIIATIVRMDEQGGTPQRYRWPWFVLAAFLLGVALAIVWMSYAVHRERQERDVNAPLPSVPAR